MIFVFPLISTYIYLYVCYILKQNQTFLKVLYYENYNYKMIIKYISIIHNLGLCFFSFYTFISLYYHIQSEYNSFYPRDWFYNDFLTNTFIINICWLFLYSTGKACAPKNVDFIMQV